MVDMSVLRSPEGRRSSYSLGFSHQTTKEVSWWVGGVLNDFSSPGTSSSGGDVMQRGENRVGDTLS